MREDLYILVNIKETILIKQLLLLLECVRVGGAQCLCHSMVIEAHGRVDGQVLRGLLIGVSEVLIILIHALTIAHLSSDGANVSRDELFGFLAVPTSHPGKNGRGSAGSTTAGSTSILMRDIKLSCWIAIFHLAVLVNPCILNIFGIESAHVE